jgi:hypothetical protein
MISTTWQSRHEGHLGIHGELQADGEAERNMNLIVSAKSVSLKQWSRIGGV